MRLLGAALILITVAPSHAANDGTWSGYPDATREWLRTVAPPGEGKQRCCDEADGKRTTWRGGASGYEVQISGEWWPVPPESVITEFNPTHETIVWYSSQWSTDGKLAPIIRCFTPGDAT
jgi:hypothetical protein